MTVVTEIDVHRRIRLLQQSLSYAQQVLLNCPEQQLAKILQRLDTTIDAGSLDRGAGLVARPRPGVNEQEPVTLGALAIDPRRGEVRIDGEPVPLTFTELRLLLALARRPGWILSRPQILHAIHGPDHVITDRAVDVMVTALRRKMGRFGGRIETVRGIGYRISDQPQPGAAQRAAPSAVR